MFTDIASGKKVPNTGRISPSPVEAQGKRYGKLC